MNFSKYPVFKKQLPEMFCKKRCSYKFRKIHRTAPVPESLAKRDSGTSVSCEFCEISKNTFFTEHLRATASGIPEYWIEHLLRKKRFWFMWWEKYQTWTFWINSILFVTELTFKCAKKMILGFWDMTFFNSGKKISSSSSSSSSSSPSSSILL